mmetsp:Transcript_113240/g.283574  ORF Transcript_113240/g.283574 Transcript_113240/m.283574 type:complete len:216 (+) Transcript_113240:445-1092(+)
MPAINDIRAVAESGSEVAFGGPEEELQSWIADLPCVDQLAVATRIRPLLLQELSLRARDPCEHLPLGGSHGLIVPATRALAILEWARVHGEESTKSPNSTHSAASGMLRQGLSLLLQCASLSLLAGRFRAELLRGLCLLVHLIIERSPESLAGPVLGPGTLSKASLCCLHAWVRSIQHIRSRCCACGRLLLPQLLRLIFQTSCFCQATRSGSMGN